MEYEPPFLETYKTLMQKHVDDSDSCFIVERCDIPLIDLGQLSVDKEECMRKIAEVAGEWGFFQVVNHGIPQELLETLQTEQKKEFYQPFKNKSTQVNFSSSLSAKSYRWGNPFATNLRQLSWSEAFHFYLTDISSMDQHESLRSSLEGFATRMFSLAESLAEILVCKMNTKSNFFKEHCSPKTCFVRLNRYPPCPLSSKVHGLLPHSDTSFLTIVHQDHVGGLQLFKDGKWVGVKPNPRALVVNIGDLFQAMSSGVYKSIKHRVVAAEKVERFSAAFFYCPSEEALIKSHINPPMYRKFTFKEYRQQSENDVKQTGHKVGLSRFLLS